MADRNHIQIAAQTESLFHARLLLLPMIGAEDRTVADRILPDAAEWKAMGYAQRVEAIANWMRAECFACLEDREQEAAA